MTGPRNQLFLRKTQPREFKLSAGKWREAAETLLGKVAELGIDCVDVFVYNTVETDNGNANDQRVWDAFFKFVFYNFTSSDGVNTGKQLFATIQPSLKPYNTD